MNLTPAVQQVLIASRATPIDIPTDDNIAKVIAGHFYDAIRSGKMTDRQVYDILKSGDLDGELGYGTYIHSAKVMHHLNDGLDFSRFAADDALQKYLNRAKGVPHFSR